MIRFPRRHPDRSFDVILCVSAPRSNDDDRNQWLHDWQLKNRRWERTWNGVDEQLELLHFSDDFSRDVEIQEHEGDRSIFRFRVLPKAVCWKDWMSKFVADFRKAYPGAVLVSVKSE